MFFFSYLKFGQGCDASCIHLIKKYIKIEKWSGNFKNNFKLLVYADVYEILMNTLKEQLSAKLTKCFMKSF